MSSASSPCGIWLACATIAVPACCRICVRDRLAVSAAKSASWMREREADMFSDVICSAAIAVSKRDCRAPSLARSLEMYCKAESTVLSEWVALPKLLISRSETLFKSEFNVAGVPCKAVVLVDTALNDLSESSVI